MVNNGNAPCYGYAYSQYARECNICEVAKGCKEETDLYDQEFKQMESISKSIKKDKEPEQADPEDFATFKLMSLDELSSFASGRGVEDKWVHTDDKIHRMQLTRAIKKTYKV